MHTLYILAAQEIEKSAAYKIGYELGYFVGSNFWTVVTVAVVLLSAILYLAFFRRKKKNSWS